MTRALLYGIVWAAGFWFFGGVTAIVRGKIVLSVASIIPPILAALTALRTFQKSQRFPSDKSLVHSMGGWLLGFIYGWVGIFFFFRYFPPGHFSDAVIDLFSALPFKQ